MPDKKTDETMAEGPAGGGPPGGASAGPTGGAPPRDVTPPDLSLADKVDAAASQVDATSTPNVPGIGVPPLATDPLGSQAADVTGEQPGDDWKQVVFRGAGPKTAPAPGPVPAPATPLPSGSPTPALLPVFGARAGTDQQIDQVGPSGRSYHFRQDVVTLVHPDDAAYFSADHDALRFSDPNEAETIS